MSFQFIIFHCEYSLFLECPGVFCRGNKAQNLNEGAAASAKKLFLISSGFSLAKAGNCILISWLMKHMSYM